MKKLLEHRLEIFIILLLAVLVLPFFIFSFFNHPGPEDTSWTENTHRSGFIKSQINLFKTGGGRFFSYALLSVNPLIFHSIEGYKIMMFLLMLSFLIVTYLFISKLFSEAEGVRGKLILTLSLFFMYLYGMPSVAQGFYYLSGFAIYNLSLMLLMLLAVISMRNENTDSKHKRVYYGAGFMLLVTAVMGSCEMAVILLLLTLLTLSIIDFISRKKINKLYAASILIIIIAGISLVYAPGNKTRSENYSNIYDLLYSLKSSFMFTITMVLYWIRSTPLSGITIMLLPLFYSISKNEKLKVRIFNANPLAALLISFTFLMSLSFLIYFTINVYPYYRIQNFIYFAFLIFWFYNILVLTFYISKKMGTDLKIPVKYFYVTGLVIITLFLFRKDNNIRIAYSELIRGKAAEYDSRMNNRYKTIYGCNTDSCLVDSISVIPRSLNEVQLSSDPMSNFNRWYSRYFHKKYVLLKREDR